MTTPDDNKFESMAKGVEFTEGCTVDPNSVTDTTPILELWNAMGEAGIQPRSIDICEDDCDHSFYYDCDMGYDRCGIDDDDTLHTLTGRAETWLLERKTTWGICKTKSETYYLDHYGETPKHYTSLPDAIRAEIGRV